ncbi:MAG: trigger factor [Evtepia sp.]|uniref:trigger factor n=1 Tax=Evtepia sp. TaxID=2773933 RepID=UPI002A765CFD|nr:trigger factor [Evtepia sp.]MDY3014829.1 trigger factor [Evtepia sp.]
MNVKSVVENKEKFEVELIVEVGQEEFEAGIDKVYRKTRGSISVPGFRKGKAPRKVIEGMYGSGVFYEDAIEELYPQACQDAIQEKGLDSVAPPRVEIIDLGKEGFTFKATVTVRPVITLKQYKGLEADKVLPTITDDAVDNELKQYVDRATQLEVVDRAAEMGDSAVLDYEGFKDGVAFQGGSAKGYELALGSHTFIPGFEEQVVGMKAGDEKTIDVSFPEDYHAEDLAGKPVQFKVKCIEVKEKKVPALDDEFAKDVSEFDTLAEFKEDLKQKIVDRNMAQSEAKFRQSLLAMLCDQVDIELPEAMVDTQINRLVDNYAARLEQQGISMEMYMQYMQMDVNKMREDLKDPAVTQIKQQLVLDAVAAAENIVVSDEDVEEEVKKAAANLNVPYERVVEGLDREALKLDLARDRAMAAVAAAAKPHLITAEADNGEIKVTEVTKDEEKSEEAEEKAEEKKPAKKPRAKKAAKPAEEGEEAAPKKTTRKKTEAEKVEE